MKENRSVQIIVTSGLLQYGDEVMIVRATSMIEEVNDTEYYIIPSWEVPFGSDPEGILKDKLETLLDIKIKRTELVDTCSFMRNSNDEQHVIELIYKVVVPPKTYRTITKCANFYFVKKEEINSFVFSERIKKVLRDSFV